MKIIGTYEEICTMNSFLLNNHPHCCEYQQPWRDIDGGHYSGKWKGFDIDFEIQRKPIIIGMIVPSINAGSALRDIAQKHGGLLPNKWPPRKSEDWICADGTNIYCTCSSESLRGHKFDELWMESLPSNWDEFDLCILSVIGKRDNIHFFNELEKEKEAE